MDPRPTAAYARADLLILLAQMLADPLAGSMALRRVATADLSALLAAASLEDPATAEALAAAHGVLVQTDRGALAAEYHRLFSCSVPCPINEAGYIRRDKGAILADIGGFHRAFGLQLASGFADRSDHLSCELEFLAMLEVLLGNALSEGLAEQVAVTSDAIAAFVGDHLGEWIEAFAERVAFTTEQSAFALLAEAILRLWRDLRAAAGWPLPSAVAAPAASGGGAAAEESHWECGMAAAEEPA